MGPGAAYWLCLNTTKILNFQDPQTASIVGQLQMPYNVQDVAVSGAYAYVADDLTGLRILDVTQPMTPTEVGSFNTAGAAFDVALTDHYAVVAEGWNGAVMLDVSNPMTPTLAATYPTRFAYGVAASGIYADVADSWNGLRVINLFSPVSSGRTAACDAAGNCATATITSGVQALAARSLARPLASAAGEEVPNLDVSILNVPPVLTSGDLITISGEARAVTSSLQALTVSVDSAILYTNTWGNGAVSETVWLVPWTPPGDGLHSIPATVLAWDGNTASQVLTFTVDTLPPDITIAPLVITSTLYHAPRALDVTGLVPDAGGIASVQVLGWQDNLAFYDASVAGNPVGAAHD